ncbi:extracellular solute-binding protein [Rhizobium sp. SSA_523]|uniref:extracellular solute-binding protein n=1 Tax=Rhizobium sp. SSA_523 TaxID=2952477 RepID=UPI00209055BD|nr:extracellular solute-binding protein [Rhizobium sp. SSA_523]MCO5732832.1 extracellular solute-binding protein [Rhizobium sp. SSA_523]WKC23550.1 extracellular solute-binding protein [Rhizobium sp. SSA_523]
MNVTPLRKTCLLLAAAAIGLAPVPSAAQDLQWRHAISILGEPALPPDFARLPYVNPDAPKSGELRLAQEGTFDSTNPVIDRGNPVVGTGLVFETLLKASEDEIATSYGMLAEAMTYPQDMSSVTFRLRGEAKWADGQPVVPDDIVFSFESAKANSTFLANYYRHVTAVEKSGEREVTFRFDEKNNRELPAIVGDLPILPKHWWQAKDGAGNARDIAKTTLEPLMGSGPYRMAGLQPGATIRYELREDYWGKDLPINIGRNNFKSISYTYFTDADVEFEAFRAGNIDYNQENSSSRWATRYDFDAVKDGRILREALRNPFRATGIMQAYVPNLRRDTFKDPRVRQALNYAFDFEDLNKNLAYGGLKRVDSFFWGTELASSGLPKGRELEILQGLKGRVPDSVFTEPYSNPVGGDPQKVRDNLRQAIGLFKQAGWELKGTRLVNTKTGQPMSFEILLNSPSQERSVLPYVASLKKIGIDARIRTVDSSQYVNRLRSFDYDMIWAVWAQTMNPGNEQANYWGSQSAGQTGSRNYAGIADPAIDELIKMITFAPNREEQVAAVHALDRVLLANHFVIPMFYAGEAKIAYWNKLAHPDRLPEYGIGFPDIWWSKNGQ